MTPFALPYNPDTAPIIDLIGLGYRPAYQPADYIGPRLDCAMWVAAPDAEIAYLTKHDLPPVDAYAVVADLPSILPSAQPVAAHLNPAPAAYAGSWVSPSFGGGSWGGSYGGDTIISGSSSTTIIRKIIREGDTIIIKYPDPWEPCGCIEPPIPPVAPVPLDASAGFLLIGLAVLSLYRWRKS